MKICNICNVEKPLCEFNISKISKSNGKKYYRGFCKKCTQIYKQISKGRINTGRIKKGSIPLNYKDGHQSLQYKKWRKDVFERDA